MADSKISAAADPLILVATDKVPMARSGSTVSYAATMAEVAAFTGTGSSIGVNIADNSGFSVNQRTYVSGTALAAAAYGHDRWKAGVSGCTYTFTASGGAATTITITAGTLQQVVEGLALLTGTYTLSWTGTAQGRSGAGSYAASPISVSATAGTNLTIEFNTGTLGQVKLEQGTVATPWRPYPQQQELAKCQRFYVAGPVGGSTGGFSTTNVTAYLNVGLPVTMRAIPIVTGTYSYSGSPSGGVCMNAQPTTLVFSAVTGTSGAYAFSVTSFTASADL